MAETRRSTRGGCANKFATKYVVVDDDDDGERDTYKGGIGRFVQFDEKEQTRSDRQDERIAKEKEKEAENVCTRFD